MEKRKFMTLVKIDDELGNNEYVQGRINGIMLIMCDETIRSQFAIVVDNEVGTIFTTSCSEEKYLAFANMIEQLYPDLCEFDYKIEK